MMHPSLSDEFWEESDDEKEWQDYLREQQEFDQAIRKVEKEMFPQALEVFRLETNTGTNSGDVLGK